MLAKINISSEEYPQIIEGEIFFKDDLPGHGLNNYIIYIEKDDRFLSIHRSKIINYNELCEFYEQKRQSKKSKKS